MTYLFNKKQWINCDGCDKPMEPVFWKHNADELTGESIPSEQSQLPKHCLNQIYGGLSFSISGGYGEFYDSDEYGENSTEPVINLTICHDCSVKMFRLFNKTRKIAGRGFHSFGNDRPICCEYGWATSDHNDGTLYFGKLNNDNKIEEVEVRSGIYS